MKLPNLLTVDCRQRCALRALELAGVSADSRTVKPGDLFVAVPGTKADGLRFVAAGARRRRRGHHGGAGAADAAARRRRLRQGRTMRAARWRCGRGEVLLRASRRSSPPSPAPAARPRSPPSRARSGPRSATRPRASAPSGWSRRKREVYGSLTTPDPVALHRTLDELARRGRHPSRDRSVVARPRPAPARRRAGRGRRLHQSQPRSSRLSSEHGGLSRRQAAAVRAIWSPPAARR